MKYALGEELDAKRVIDAWWSRKSDSQKARVMRIAASVLDDNGIHEPASLLYQQSLVAAELREGKE